MMSPYVVIALVYVGIGAVGLIFGEYSFKQQRSASRLRQVRYVIQGDRARYWAYGWFVAAVTPFIDPRLAFVALVVMAIVAIPLLEQESRAESRARRTRAKLYPQAAGRSTPSAPVSKAAHARINAIDPNNATPGDIRELVRIVEKGADAGLDWREALMAGDQQGSSDIQAGSRAYEILRKIGEPALPYLLEADLSKNNFKGIFQKIGDPAVEPLLALLADERPGQRAGAASVLGLMGVQAAVEPIIALLDVDDETVRIQAVTALGMLGDERAREPIERLRGETTLSRALNTATLRALSKLKESA